MPALVAWLLGGLGSIAGQVVGRALLSLGFGWLAYKGMDTTLTWLKSQALAGFSGLTPQVLGLLATMKVGESISIVFSALLVRLTLQGFKQGGAIYKMVRTG